MVISGLVLTLNGDIESLRLARVRLAADSRIELGPLMGRKLPLVVETASQQEERELWHWLHEVPGVVHCDVAFVQVVEPRRPDTRHGAPGAQKDVAQA